MTQKIPIGILLLPIIFVLLGGWLSIRCGRGHVERLFASFWATTSGKITGSALETVRGREGGMSYEVKVTYEYAALGRTFTGTRIHPTYVGDWHIEAHEGLHRRLPADSTVRVYYHPSDPSRSYLATRFVSTGFVPLLMSLMFLGAGLAFGTIMLLVNYGNHDYAVLISAP
jgi:hypothetical protein